MHPDADPSPDAFLAAFHDERRGLTSGAFGSLPVTVAGVAHRSSYQLLADALPAASDESSVLDLACGDGFLLALLADRQGPAGRLTGIDFSAGELLRAQRRLGGRANLVRGSALHLPFAAGAFDHVVCHLALMLMDRTDQAVLEVRRVLKPGGMFAAVVGAPSPSNPALAVFTELLSRHPRMPRFAAVRFGDRRTRTPEGIQDLLAGGFDNVVVHDIAIARRLTPPEIWQWLGDMYDLYLLGAVDRATVELDFMRALEPLRAADGKVRFDQALRFFSGRAA